MSPAALAAVMEATWPAEKRVALGPFTLREGAGGGQRVSAATAEAGFSAAELQAAIAAMDAPLFAIYPERGAVDQALDAALAAEGFVLHDPVVAYAAPVSALTGELPYLTAFPHWPPLEAARGLWAEGGIGPGRVAVMARVQGPHAALLGRIEDRPSGAAFVALHDGVAMLHALEVRPAYRRRGLARHLLRAAANWAAEAGAKSLSLVVTERNSAARALYEQAGMVEVGRYHYRKG
ncbi:GNAT family N-acetyltransferase [Xinfangfangia sp. CPCC 101601]|uniref:GNAT family N-acetyltransferase n=1 Tax=Pseudogemmobacter lacusdianii TaxID=3069608 RepID=A0ABU0W0B9_9RHOB|nr:GNAT family N-acetyltransferase [Xinfangfangia sp. CPCC 101601]MDQ2066880.1 GNAT family N-acetyltransferase [Xinfangfangia sp. CPCC 101601]